MDRLGHNCTRLLNLQRLRPIFYLLFRKDRCQRFHIAVLDTVIIYINYQSLTNIYRTFEHILYSFLIMFILIYQSNSIFSLDNPLETNLRCHYRRVYSKLFFDFLILDETDCGR